MQFYDEPAVQEVDFFDMGDRIRILRINQKKTLQEVADSCGLSKSMISKIENGKTIPSVATLVKIAQSLGTSISILLEKEGISSIKVFMAYAKEFQASDRTLFKAFKIISVVICFENDNQ